MFRTYKPKDVILQCAGGKIEGWEDISISMNSEQARQVKGIFGKYSKVSNHADTAATIRVTVSYGSETNKVFTLLAELDRKYFGGTRFNVLMKDSSGDGVVFESSEAYLQGMPEESWSGSAGSKTWVILCDSSKWTLSGESTPTESIVDDILSKVFQ